MIDRQTLEHYICEIGEQATAKQFKLTEKQIESILYGKVVKEGRYTYVEKEYIPYEPSSSPDLKQLERVITENYKEIYKTHVAKKMNINTRSLSHEDILQSGLLSILKNADSFTYVDDSETLKYINKALKHDKLNAITANKVGQKHTAILKSLVTPDSLEQDTEDNDLESVFKRHNLSNFQQDICRLLVDGFNQTEIAEKLGVTRKTIYNNKKQLENILAI